MPRPIDDKNLASWSKLYGEAVSPTEYDEICTNVNGFFTVLKSWDAKEKENVISQET